MNRLPLAGVMGWPIAHSRSPLLHRHWLARHDVAGDYVALGVEPKHLDQALAALPLLGFKGVNVTLPHKEEVLKRAAQVSDRAALIGAANTLTFREDGSFHADNTDGFGFLENLRQGAPGWSAKTGPALVLGAGGAARAVVSALLTEGTPQVLIANRTRTRADALAETFGARAATVDWHAAPEALSGAALLVNSTSLGMTGQPALAFDLRRAPKGCVVNDLVYPPLETDLLRQARERGLTPVDGLGMLLHQGRPGFEGWFGPRPEVDDALRAAVLGDAA